MAAPLAADGQAWPRTKNPSFSHARSPGLSHNSQWECCPWGLEDRQPPRCGGICGANQALLIRYERATAYLDRFCLVLAMYIAILVFYSLRQLT